MIYLDYNATTPVAPEAARAMTDAQDRLFANASSVQHAPGRAAAAALEQATEEAGSNLGTSPRDLTWCSGATEGLRWSILGMVLTSPPDHRTIVIGATEHKAALDAAAYAETYLGARCRYVAPSPLGFIEPAAVREALDDSVCLAVIMMANNETGALNPIVDIQRECSSLGVPLLCDVTQAIGKVPVGQALAISDISVCSSHKFYGPKGVGLLIAPRDIRKRLAAGLPGGHASGLRGGTPAVPAIVGAASALGYASGRLTETMEHSRRLIEHLVGQLQRSLTSVHIVTGSADRVPNTVNLRFEGADAEAVMHNMPGLAVATGSACNVGIPAPSHVLTAMGLSPAQADECIRISVGIPTTLEEIDIAANEMTAAVLRVRQLTAA